MKVIFTLLLAILIQVSYAQKYQPLVEKGKYWIYAIYNYGDNPCDFWWVSNAEIHHFGEDTLLNNFKYKKILKSSLQLDSPMGNITYPFEILSTSVMGYIREDTILKKVYVLPNDLYLFPCNEEYKENLMYDFSLSQGDSINDC